MVDDAVLSLGTRVLLQPTDPFVPAAATSRHPNGGGGPPGRVRCRKKDIMRAIGVRPRRTGRALARGPRWSRKHHRQISGMMHWGARVQYTIVDSSLPQAPGPTDQHSCCRRPPMLPRLSHCRAVRRGALSSEVGDLVMRRVSPTESLRVIDVVVGGAAGAPPPLPLGPPTLAAALSL